ncbi:DUF4817 domain-containing protein [Nephila pilipes]|uniref:DUF4817 domain-containing protein n=1 Tax=Nephila pilipes TaxID=299642 RepID=A0A8X6NZE8_NEPPI|nr:DUF4817 domain-containing protein [Nephila pilipes]
MRTVQRKVQCVLWLTKFESVTKVQCDYRRVYKEKLQLRNNIIRWVKQLKDTGSLLDKPRSGRPLVNDKSVEAIRKRYLKSPKKFGAENRHAYAEYNRNTPKMNVWCGLMHDEVTGTFFFAEQTGSSNNYLGMLELFAETQFPEGVIFQYDGASPHFANIVHVICFVTPGFLNREWEELEYRLELCRITNGGHIKLHRIDDLAVLVLPEDFFSEVAPVSRRLEIRAKSLCLSGTDAFRPSPKCVRKALYVAIAELLFS